MKTKGKKADKTKALPITKSSTSTKEDKRVEVKAPVVTAAKEAPEQFLGNAPIEVLQEERTLAAPVVAARRTISNDERRRLIALAAYYRAQRAGFGKTNPVEDWLLAEREVDAMMASGNAI